MGEYVVYLPTSYLVWAGRGNWGTQPCANPRSLLGGILPTWAPLKIHRKPINLAGKPRWQNPLHKLTGLEEVVGPSSTGWRYIGLYTPRSSAPSLPCQWCDRCTSGHSDMPNVARGTPLMLHAARGACFAGFLSSQCHPKTEKHIGYSERPLIRNYETYFWPLHPHRLELDTEVDSVR